MTIFYGGQAHVFDDVHPNKVILLSLCLNTFIFKLYMNANVSLQADVIMALAGSSGGSWSTDLSHKLKTKNNTSDGPYKLGQMFEGGGSSRETPFLSPEIRGRPVHQDTSSACHRMFTQPGDFLFKKKKNWSYSYKYMVLKMLYVLQVENFKEVSSQGDGILPEIRFTYQILKRSRLNMRDDDECGISFF